MIIDLAEVNFDRVVADLEGIRQYNPQRFEMEQLTAVVLYDEARQICVGYRDLTPDEFWIRGHMPGMSLMPGVLQCEAAAQLSSFYVMKSGNLPPGAMLGFGALDEVRFRDPVMPGSRLVVVTQLTKMRRNVMMNFHFQEFVNTSLVCEGELKGIPLPVERLKAAHVARG